MRLPRSGFTMVEVLIVTALTIATAVAGFTGFSSFRKSQTLKLGVHELSAALSAARQQAIAQENGTAWGVRLTSGTSTNPHTYKIFSGNSFAAGTTTQNYVLGRGAKFSNPYTSSTLDIIFAGATGFPSSSQIISLINGYTDGQVGDVIIKSLGNIITRLDSGLVGYWHLDETTSTSAYDSSGLGNIGTLTNSPTRTVIGCKSGNCLTFDGINDYVQISDSNSLRPGFITVMAWFNVINKVPQQKIVSKTEGGSFSLSLNENNVCGTSNYCFAIHSGGSYRTATAPISVINNGVWHFGSGTYDGSSVKLYLDGSLIASTTYAGSIAYSATPVCIGSESTSGSCSAGEYLAGKIDEVKIYNRALSAAEILAAYNDLK